LRHKTEENEFGETVSAKPVRDLIEAEQETELVLAAFNGSKLYQIKEPFEKFQISSDEWLAMTQEQGKKESRKRLCC